MFLLFHTVFLHSPITPERPPKRPRSHQKIQESCIWDVFSFWASHNNFSGSNSVQSRFKSEYSDSNPSTWLGLVIWHSKFLIQIAHPIIRIQLGCEITGTDSQFGPSWMGPTWLFNFSQLSSTWAQLWEARQDCARGRRGGGGGLGGVVEVEAVEGKLLLSSQFNVKPHVVNVNLVNLDLLGIPSLGFYSK